MVLTSHATADTDLANKHPQLLAQALEPVAEDLAALKKLLPQYIPAQTQSAQEIIAHVFSAGGKHIRPALYLMACQLMAYRGPHLLPIAAVCEYVHTASLLHDDVVDNSSQRRNKPTANKLWGDASAVLVGDLIYATASELMAQTGKLEIVTSFAAAIRQMSEGELLQLENILHLDLSEEVYFRILSGKTATLMGACCRAAAILSEASLAQRQALEDFGHYLGLAFQLIDDALDYTGMEQIFGKRPFADLHEGKITLPVILLKKCANDEEKTYLSQAFHKQGLHDEDIGLISGLVQKYKTAHQTMARANEFTRRALQALTLHFEPSCHRLHLESLAQSLLYRMQ